MESSHAAAKPAAVRKGRKGAKKGKALQLDDGWRVKTLDDGWRVKALDDAKDLSQSHQENPSPPSPSSPSHPHQSEGVAAELPEVEQSEGVAAELPEVEQSEGVAAELPEVEQSEGVAAELPKVDKSEIEEEEKSGEGYCSESTAGLSSQQVEAFGSADDVLSRLEALTLGVQEPKLSAEQRRLNDQSQEDEVF